MKTMTAAAAPAADRVGPPPAKPLTDWRLYAAAGAAALAATSAADAAVITGTLNADLTFKHATGLSSVKRTFMIDGVKGSLTLRRGTYAGRGIVRDSVRFNCSLGRSNGGLDFVNSGGSGFFAAAKDFPQGANISPSPISEQNYGAFRIHGPDYNIGSFPSNKPGYAGFQLPASKGGGMGFLKVEIDGSNGYPTGGTALNYAFDNAGGDISAGETSSVPEPTGLALLATGSAGVLAWRRRRAGVPSNG